MPLTLRMSGWLPVISPVLVTDAVTMTGWPWRTRSGEMEKLLTVNEGGVSGMTVKNPPRPSMSA